MEQQVSESRTVARRCGDEPGVVPWCAVRGVAFAAAGAAAAVWVAARLVGVELVAGAGSGQQVALPSVVVASLVASYAGAGALRLLQRHTGRAHRTWVAVALLVLVVSLAGPVGARTPDAILVLAAMHVVVAVIVVAGLLGRARAERCGPVPAATLTRAPVVPDRTA